LPLIFESEGEFENLKQGETVHLTGLRDAIKDGTAFHAKTEDGTKICFANDLSERQGEILLSGGIISWCRD